jgi:hypothetical protein
MNSQALCLVFFVVSMVSGLLTFWQFFRSGSSMTHKIYLFLISLAISAGFPISAATSSTVVDKLTSNSVSVSNLRNKRYCEVLYGERSFLTLVVKVFSTQGLNDCPQDAWKLITSKTISDTYKASFVRLNGPRYWVIDGVQAAGNTVNHERESFGGIEMNLRATIEVGLFKQLQLFWGDPSYQATTVHRNTIWIYKAGSPVYELISPSGEHYVMQSYAQIVNTKLSMADLPMLQKQLQLPQGWSYRTRMLTEDLHLVANGNAYVLQDNLMNSYQHQ